MLVDGGDSENSGEGSIPFTRSFHLSIMTYLFQLTEISVSPNRES